MERLIAGMSILTTLTWAIVVTVIMCWIHSD